METDAHHDDATTDGPVSLTGAAAARVRKLLEKERRPDGAGLRVAVVGGGCSGFQYSLDLADAPAAEDAVLVFDGVRVFVDPGSAGYLGGTIVDYVDGLHGAGFKFVNPKAQRTCGCGSSFAV